MAFPLGAIAALAMSAAGAQTWPAAAAVDAQASAPATEDQTDALLRQYDAALFGRRFDQALEAAGKLQPDNAEGQAYVAALKASALLGLKRESGARDLIAKAERLAPASPDASRMVFVGALVAERPDFAADALDRLLARAPDVVRDLDWQLIRAFLANEPKGQEVRNEDRRIALARIGYGGDSEIGHWRVANAVDILVKRGDFSGAGELLQYVNEPQPLENMLVQKRYSPLWPKLQDLAGAHFEKVRESSVRSAEREFASAPDDHEKLQHYVNALRHAGRLDDAIALRAKLPATTAAMSLADEQMGWAINNVALALHEAGRGDEADALFAMLNDAPMPAEDWRVSTKINRIELLVLDGKFEKALPLIEPAAKTEGSPYAEQLVRRLRYCTLSGLGRKDDAARVLPDLVKHAEDAPGPTVDGLLCAGDLDRAERVALDNLKKKDSFTEDFVRQLQAHPLTADDPSVWQGRWRELRARAAIQQEFDRLGRDMPADLLVQSAKSVASK